MNQFICLLFHREKMGAEGNTVQDSPAETMSLDKVEDLLEVPKLHFPNLNHPIHCFTLLY